MKNVHGFVLAVGLSVVINLIQAVPSGTQRLSPGDNYGRAKGDRGDFLESGLPKWDSSKIPQEKDSHRNKGDLGTMDPRGTVRYNILADGRIAKGIITSQGTEEAEGLQAMRQESHADTYSPVLDSEEEV